MFQERFCVTWLVYDELQFTDLRYSNVLVHVLQMNGGSHNGNEQPHGISTKRVLERWDVVGLGQAMVATTFTPISGFLITLVP